MHATTLLGSRHWLAATVLCLLAATGAWAQPAARAEAEIGAIMAKYQAVGVSVAVVNGTDLVYRHSFGLKNLGSGEALADDDLFRIASISKSFVATGLLQQVEAGKLSLDDDVGALIGFRVRNPNFPDSAITLRMILSHTSSIGDRNGYFTLDAFNPEKTADWAKAYNDYAPGARYQYCNLNFNLAGAILEKVSGERFDRYIHRHILQPLGLYGGYNADALDSSRFVTLYAYDGNTGAFAAEQAYVSPAERLKDYVDGYSTPAFSPTGGMKISAADLARYMTMHMHDGTYKGVRILSEESTQLMQTALSDEEGYGLALRTMDNLLPGKVLKGHNGVAYGLYSAMFFQPQEKFGIVVITNGCNTGYTEGVNDFLREVYGSLYRNFVLSR